MKFVNAAGFVVDADEVLWLSQNTENSGGGFTVQLRNNAVVKIPYPQGVALTSLLTEPYSKPVILANEVKAK